MAAIENFVLKIKVEGQKAVDDLKKSVTDIGTTFGASSNKITSAISGIVGGMGGLATIAGTAAAAFVGLGMKAIALADELGDVSDATGIAAGALNTFRNSIVDAGGKTEDFSTLALKLNQNLGDAAVGNEKAQKAFQKLGVYVTDAGGAVRNTGDVLRDAIAKLAAIQDPATRAALAVDLFGKNAAKLDFTKLNAANDFAKDEQIAQLIKYQNAIDKIAESVSNNLLTVFGKLAIAIDESQKKAQKVEEEANKRGNVGPRVTAIGGSLTVMPERPMTKAEKDRYDLEQKLAEAYKDQAREMDRLGKINKPASGGGGFGATPEATLKAIAESRKRLTTSNIEAEKNERLQAANEIQAIEINAQAETRKAANTIYAQERLSNAQMDAEYAAKKKEIETKAALDIAKIRNQQNAKIFTEEEAQRQKIQEELAAEETRINNIVEGSRKIVEEIANQNKEMADKAKFILDAATMTDQERANAQALFDIEQQRLVLLKQIADIKDLPYAERLAKEKEVNDLIAKRKTDAVANQEATAKQQKDFSAGWGKAYRQYVEDGNNSFARAGSMFSTLSRGFEDSMVRFVQTGKLSFKDLFNNLIAEAVRAQSNKLLSGILGSVGGSFFGSLFGGGSSGMFGGSVMGLPGYAAGGSIPAGQLSVVGESGPELFLPRSAGTIIPNSGLGGQTNNTAVTYNISAVDAQSFKSMLARDPEFIHNVAEQGRRSMPIRSRR